MVGTVTGAGLSDGARSSTSARGRAARIALVAAVGLERLAELRVSERNARRSLAAGGTESGAGHYPAMVALHSGLLLACVVEPLVRPRRSPSTFAWTMAGGVAGAQVLRWWCITTLGPAWSTRVVVVPGAPRVERGPYHWLRHPNYVAVVIEGAALPLAVGAPITAAGFSMLNVALLRVRIRVENEALQALAPAQDPAPAAPSAPAANAVAFAAAGR